MPVSSFDLLTTKRGAIWACSQRCGDVGGHGAEGVFVDDARHLSRLVLKIDEARPQLLSCSDVSGHEATIRLAHERDLSITRKRSIDAALSESFELHNYGAARTILVELEVACDFADIFAIRGWATKERATEPSIANQALSYERRGRDGVTRSTKVAFDPPPSSLAPGPASTFIRWELTLDQGDRASIEMHCVCAPLDETGYSPRPPLRGGMNESRIGRALAAAGRDLEMLCTPLDGRTILAAGVPWYVALFGRDSLLTALALLDAAPEIARDTLLTLAARQAADDDPTRDAEPGKILHELRHGELASAGLLPFSPYYGSADATPLFVQLAAEYLLRTGDRATFETLQPHLRRALRGVDELGDADGDGFVEYQRRAENGLVNQGWKDSPDAIVHADGTVAGGPVALCEVQGYVYAAKARLADGWEATGRSKEAGALRAQAAELKRVFHEAFWIEEQDCFALALDGAKHQVSSVTSNAAHCLWSGIVDDDLASRLAGRLMAADMFSGWGLRTLSANSPAFNPMSYHRGSVWPHDSALAAAGLARYGFQDEADQITEALLDVAEASHANRLPELLCGFDRTPGEPYVAYPQTCAPQAWAAASVFLLARLHN